MRRRAFLSLSASALGLAGAVTLASCGSSDNTSSTGASTASASVEPTTHTPVKASDTESSPTAFGEPVTLSPFITGYCFNQMMSSQFAVFWTSPSMIDHSNYSGYVDLADLTTSLLMADAGTGEYRVVVLKDEDASAVATVPGAAYTMTAGRAAVTEEAAYFLTGLSAVSKDGQAATQSVDLVKVELATAAVSSTSLWTDVDASSVDQHEVLLSDDGAAVIVMTTDRCVAVSTADLSVLHERDIKTSDELVGRYLAVSNGDATDIVSLTDGSVAYSVPAGSVLLAVFGTWAYVGTKGTGLAVMDIEALNAVDLTSGALTPVKTPPPDSMTLTSVGQGMAFTSLANGYLVTCGIDAFEVREPGAAEPLFTLNGARGEDIPDSAVVHGSTIYATYRNSDKTLHLLSLSDGSKISTTPYPASELRALNHFVALSKQVNGQPEASELFIPATKW